MFFIFDLILSYIKEKNINIKTLNNVTFQKVNTKKFPSVLFLKKCLNMGHSAPTIINASNEVLVNLFLNGKISFLDIVRTINRVFNDKDFKKYAKRKPNSVKEIKTIDNWARLKTNDICVR